MNKKCAVYCTADDNYIFPSIVALQSVRRFHPECDFFVIGNQGIISKNKLGVLKRFDIHFLHSDQNELFAGSHWPSTCYLALLGPEMLWEKGYEYSLGLDADILCVQPLDLDEVFSMTVGYAGIENQRARKGNFKDPDFVRRKYGLSDNDLDGHNTNTGVVFWNNKAVADSKLGERSIKCFQECFSEDSRMIRGDQSLFALVSILEPALPWLILPRGYNYRIHNVDDQKEDIKEGDIRIYHFIGRKPWESISVRQRLLNPSVVSHRDKWFAFVGEQGIFNRDLTIKSGTVLKNISKNVCYAIDECMTTILVNPSVVSLVSTFVALVRRMKAVVRKARQGKARLLQP